MVSAGQAAVHPCVVVGSHYHLPDTHADLSCIPGDSPELPLHPVTARITTMIRSTPEIATLEHLDRVFCMIYPRYNSTQEIPAPDALAVLVRRADELVHVAEVSARPWKDIESYLCW